MVLAPLKLFAYTPALDTSAFATGDQVGPGSSKLTKVFRDNLGFGILQQIKIIDEAKQSAALDLLFWKSLPTITSVENAAFDASDAQVKAKFAGYVSILAADYCIMNANSVAIKRDINQILRSIRDTDNPLGEDLWVSLISRGSPTYAAASLTIELGLQIG